MRVLLSETQALLPNLDTIEDALRLTCVHNLNSDGTTFNMGDALDVHEFVRYFHGIENIYQRDVVSR